MNNWENDLLDRFETLNPVILARIANTSPQSLRL